MCAPVSLDAHQIYTHMHVHTHGYGTPSCEPLCEDVCTLCTRITTVCDWRQSVHTAQPTRFSRTGSVSPGEAGSHMPLQGAGKPGSGQRLGAARRLYLSSAGRWAAPVSLGTKILESAGGAKGERRKRWKALGTGEAAGPHSLGLSLFLCLPRLRPQGRLKK